MCQPRCFSALFALQGRAWLREELQRQVQVLLCLPSATGVSRSMSLVMKQNIHLYGFMGMLYITLPIFIKKKSHLFEASELIKMVKCQMKSNLSSVHGRKIIYYQQKFLEKNHVVWSHIHTKMVKDKENYKCHSKCLICLQLAISSHVSY